MHTNRHEFHKAILSHSNFRCLKLRMTPLLKWNSPQRKLHDQRIFVRLLNKTMPESVENLDGTSDDLKHLVFQ